MRLDYNILWFEDNKASYATKKVFVRDIIEDFGFNFIEPRNEKNGANIDSIPYNMYDLIIADMTLSEGVTAMSLLDAIRKKSIFTEVLFYSSNGENAVREELAKYNIDGAYCSGRNNEDFEYKVREVICTLIKKTQDLNNLRGLVMAEVSELDAIMEQIITLFFATPDRMQAFHKHIIENREESIHKTLQPSQQCDKKCFHIWRTKNISEYVHKLESSQKAHAINLVLEQIDSQHILYPDKKFYKTYEDDIILNRNNLAHCKSIRDENGNEILKTDKGDRIYTEQDFKNIRTNIIKYHQMFIKLFETLKANA